MVTRLIPRDLWIAEGLFPAWYCKRIRARSTSRTGAAREACNVSSRFSSSEVKAKAGSLDFPAMLPTVACQAVAVNVLMKRCTSMDSAWRSLEELPDLVAFPCTWRLRLGQDYEAFKILCLQDSAIRPISYPCPLETSCAYRIGLRHNVVTLSAGSAFGNLVSL